MAKNSWRGDAQDVARVVTVTVGGTAADADTITVTINRKSVTYVLDGDTLATAAAALFALISAANIVEFGEVQWSYEDGDTFITATAATPGVPFDLAASDSGGTTTLTAVETVASAGKNHYDDAGNWTLGTNPTGSDDVVIEGDGASLLYGSGTIDGNSIEVRGSFSNAVGLPRHNSGGYYEYRNRYVTLNSATVKIGEGDGTGSGQLYVKGIAGATITVYKTGSRLDEAFPALDIDLTGNPTAVRISGGDAGICVFNEATARTVAALATSGADTRVTVGRSVTVTDWDKDEGQGDVYGTVTLVTNAAGAYNQEDGTLTAIVCYSGYCKLNQTGAVASAEFLGPDATCDTTGNSLARTFTNATFTGGGRLLDPNKSVTFTNPATFDRASLEASDLGPAFTIQRA